MSTDAGSGDRSVLTVTAWLHDTEVVGVVRWRPSLATPQEEVSSARGVDDILAVVEAQLRALEPPAD